MNTATGLGRWSWGGGGVQRNELTANTEPDYLNVEQAISLAAGSAQANQLVPCGNNVIACRFHVNPLSALAWLTSDHVSLRMIRGLGTTCSFSRI